MQIRPATALLRLLLVGLLPNLGACPLFAPLDALNVQVAGIEPLTAGGVRMCTWVKLRVRRPNDFAVVCSGVALDLEVNGGLLASAVGDQQSTVPRFGARMLNVPTPVSAFSAARQ